MKKAMIFAIAAVMAAITIGCGGAGKENETPRSQNVAPAPNTGNSTAGSPASRNDADADDKTGNRPVTNSTSNRAGTRRIDLDDVKRSGNTNSVRKDADDKGKSDSDRDDDDH